VSFSAAFAPETECGLDSGVRRNDGSTQANCFPHLQSFSAWPGTYTWSQAVIPGRLTSSLWSPESHGATLEVPRWAAGS